MWIPQSEIIIQVPEEEKLLYEANDARCFYHSSRWTYRKGRHNKGEFPVVVARKHFHDLGYIAWASGQSKLGNDVFILAMFPGARARRDLAYLNMIEMFGEKKIRSFIEIVEKEKKDMGIPRHGGDPDLFIMNAQNPGDRFFAEAKAEDLTGKSSYKDKLNKQQLLVFPLIEKHLGCQVRLVRIQIVPTEWRSPK